MNTLIDYLETINKGSILLMSPKEFDKITEEELQKLLTNFKYTVK